VQKHKLEGSVDKVSRDEREETSRQKLRDTLERAAEYKAYAEERFRVLEKELNQVKLERVELQRQVQSGEAERDEIQGRYDAAMQTKRR